MNTNARKADPLFQRPLPTLARRTHSPYYPRVSVTVELQVTRKPESAGRLPFAAKASGSARRPPINDFYLLLRMFSATPETQAPSALSHAGRCGDFVDQLEVLLGRKFGPQTGGMLQLGDQHGHLRQGRRLPAPALAARFLRL